MKLEAQHRILYAASILSILGIDDNFENINKYDVAGALAGTELFLRQAMELDEEDIGPRSDDSFVVQALGKSEAES